MVKNTKRKRTMKGKGLWDWLKGKTWATKKKEISIDGTAWENLNDDEKMTYCHDVYQGSTIKRRIPGKYYYNEKKDKCLFDTNDQVQGLLEDQYRRALKKVCNENGKMSEATKKKCSKKNEENNQDNQSLFEYHKAESKKTPVSKKAYVNKDAYALVKVTKSSESPKSQELSELPESSESILNFKHNPRDEQFLISSDYSPILVADSPILVAGKKSKRRRNSNKKRTYKGLKKEKGS
jgi:hypothetical protein